MTVEPFLMLTSMADGAIDGHVRSCMQTDRDHSPLVSKPTNRPLYRMQVGKLSTSHNRYLTKKFQQLKRPCWTTSTRCRWQNIDMATVKVIWREPRCLSWTRPCFGQTTSKCVGSSGWIAWLGQGRAPLFRWLWRGFSQLDDSGPPSSPHRISQIGVISVSSSQPPWFNLYTNTPDFGLPHFTGTGGKGWFTKPADCK